MHTCARMREEAFSIKHILANVNLDKHPHYANHIIKGEIVDHKKMIKSIKYFRWNWEHTWCTPVSFACVPSFGVVGDESV